MERLEEITSVILNTISDNEKSLNIAELAKLTGIHRNVLAKYIKVLEAQGKIEISRIGAKKFVHLSQRVPISFLKNFTHQPFFVFDRYLTVVDKNEEVSELYTQERINPNESESQNTLLSIFLTEKTIPLLHNAFQGQRATVSIESAGPTYPHTYSLSIIPVVFDNGRPGSALVIENSTKREQEKREYTQIKNAYRELLENQVQFVVRFNGDYKILSINNNFSVHTGIEEKFLIGSQFIPPYPEDNYETVKTQMSSISQNNPVLSLDLRRINKTGDFSWERWRIQGVYDKKTGKIFEYFAVGLDVTELKRSEQEFIHLKNNLETIIQTRTIELREVNNELHKEIYRREIVERELTLTKFATDSAHDFIFLLNSKGDIQYMNVRAQKKFSKPEQSIQNFRTIIINDPKTGSADPFTFSINEMIDSGILTVKGSLHSVHGKDIPVEITMSRIIEQNEMFFCCIARDITDRKKIEGDLYKYRKHLEEIIEERTKRLQEEIDSKHALEIAYHQSEARVHLFTDNSVEALFIYDEIKKQFLDLNLTAEQMFSINQHTINQSVSDQLSLVILKNDQSLMQFINEKLIHLRNGENEIFNNFVISGPLSGKEISIRLRMIKLKDLRYIRISIIDISDYGS